MTEDFGLNTALNRREMLALASSVFGAPMLMNLKAPQKPGRLEIHPPPGASFVFGFGEGDSAISPNGRLLSFVARHEGKTQLWMQPLNSRTARPLSGAEDAACPFWSPDSRWVGFFANGKLQKISVDGGAPRALAETHLPRGGSWSQHDVILFTFGETGVAGGSLYRVPAAGGTVQPVTKGETRWPCFLPDGRSFLYLRRTSDPRTSSFEGHVCAASLDAPQNQVTLFESVSKAVFAAGGGGRPDYLLWLRPDRTLIAHRFDASKLRLEGDPVPILDNIQAIELISAAHFSASMNGVLVAGRGNADISQHFTWRSRDGRRVGNVGEARMWLVPRLSSDGRSVAAYEGGIGLWLIDLNGNVATRVSSGPGLARTPVWSPDGKWIAYLHNGVGGATLRRKDVGGQGKEEILVLLGAAGGTAFVWDWTPDGKYLLHSLGGPVGPIYLLPVSADEKVSKLLFDGKFRETGVSVSPEVIGWSTSLRNPVSRRSMRSVSPAWAARFVLHLRAEVPRAGGRTAKSCSSFQARIG